MRPPPACHASWGSLHDARTCATCSTAQATEAPQGKDGSATDVMNPAKRLVTARALSVQAERVGAPLNWNPHHPVRSLEALRLILAAPEARRVEVSMRLFK